MAMIRDARPDERDALGALALRSKAHWGYDAEFMERCRDELTVTADQIDSIRVIERGGEVLGFYGLSDLGDGRAELDYLFVDPSAIGTGLGRALIEHALSRAAAGGFVELVIHGDPNALSFYRAAGAIEIGEVPSASIPGRNLPLLSIALTASR
jgi:GNAT superfamily N-acetyltransferase